jgi:hypothetical protein
LVTVIKTFPLSDKLRIISALLVALPSVLSIIGEGAYLRASYDFSLLVAGFPLLRLLGLFTILALSLVALRRSGTVILIAGWSFLLGRVVIAPALIVWSFDRGQFPLDWMALLQLFYLLLGMALALAAWSGEHREPRAPNPELTFTRYFTSGAVFAALATSFYIEWQSYVARIISYREALSPGVPIDLPILWSTEHAGRELAVLMLICAVAPLLLRCRRITLLSMWFFALGLASEDLQEFLRRLAAGYSEREGVIMATILALSLAGLGTTLMPARGRVRVGQ